LVTKEYFEIGHARHVMVTAAGHVQVMLAKLGATCWKQTNEIKMKVFNFLSFFLVNKSLILF